jgi:hypothetical protein
VDIVDLFNFDDDECQHHHCQRCDHTPMTWDDIETSVKHFVSAKTTTETLNEMTKITCNILLHVATGESNVTFAEAMQSNYLISKVSQHINTRSSTLPEFLTPPP